MVSASKREGIDFDMPLMDFADCITPDDMAQWNQAIAPQGEEPAADDEQKKRL